MSYVTGNSIRELREKRRFTQRELAEKIHVSDKTISKWETGKGLPDIGILEECDEDHNIDVETVDNEYHITLSHPMDKKHYISFVAYVTADNVEIAKLYPEQMVSVRFRRKGHGMIYAFCNRHGMYRAKV